MKEFLTMDDIQAKCEKLNEIYQIDDQKFFRIIEKWADTEMSAETKLINSYQELLQLVSDEIEEMEQAVSLHPTCQMGCAFCCYFPIVINEMEAKLMQQSLHYFSDERKQKLAHHLQAYYRKYQQDMDEISSFDQVENPNEFKLAFKSKQIPCVMLDTETNQCMAYEIRPTPCRTYMNYTDPKVCEENVMPKETVSFEFLYAEYMGALNEFLQYLYEEGDTGFIDYPNDIYREDLLINWMKDFDKELLKNS
ncbi:YkgJ family cysteine cluster protein [Gracilibacillus sp. YIM 98692]|uniref:YkgJ family cysteine cluster protein n=1 Tax=Gracilibacillus sp. YIM 98692 TaxID=2663532 RepID=UPI0013D68999|nr:YkgJ family cysteine cluster protein [Gracilibacillus sp. YIM 98692]